MIYPYARAVTGHVYDRHHRKIADVLECGHRVEVSGWAARKWSEYRKCYACRRAAIRKAKGQ